MSRRVLRGAGAPGGAVRRRDRRSGVVAPSTILADRVIAVKTDRRNVQRGELNSVGIQATDGLKFFPFHLVFLPVAASCSGSLVFSCLKTHSRRSA